MTDRRSVLATLTGISATAALGVRPGSLWAESEAPARARETIAVLGTGRFGGSIGKRLSTLGYPVVYGSRTPDTDRVRELIARSGPAASVASLKDAAAQSSIVVFAVPWEPVKALLPQLGSMTGKLLIDPMIAKPVIVEGYPFPAHTPMSTAEQLQAWVPDAHVVKAFISISYGTLADPARAGGPVSVPYAGAAGSAKERVAQIIAELGLEAMDAGPLICATHLENLLWFEVAINRSNKGLYELSLRKVRS